MAASPRALDDDLLRRIATASDADVIVDWFPDASAAISWGGPALPNPLTAAWLAEQFTIDRYWVWTTGTDTVAAVFGFKFPEPDRAHLQRFGIAPPFRGRGLAQKLLAEARDLARQYGAKHLSLSVYLSNPVARKAYDRAGFKVTDERDGKSDPGGRSVGMALSI